MLTSVNILTYQTLVLDLVGKVVISQARVGKVAFALVSTVLRHVKTPTICNLIDD